MNYNKAHQATKIKRILPESRIFGLERMKAAGLNGNFRGETYFSDNVKLAAFHNQGGFT